MFQFSFEPSSGNIHVHRTFTKIIIPTTDPLFLGLIAFLQYTILGRICFSYSNVFPKKLYPSPVLKIVIALQMLRQYNVRILQY
jgi:hypothetical protein